MEGNAMLSLPTCYLMHCYWEPSPSPRAVSCYRDGHEWCCLLLLAFLGMQMEQDNFSLPLPPKLSTAGSYCQHGHYTWGSVPEWVSGIAPAQLHLGLKWIENQLYHKQDVQLVFTKRFFKKRSLFSPHHRNKARKAVSLCSHRFSRQKQILFFSQLPLSFLSPLCETAKDQRTLPQLQTLRFALESPYEAQENILDSLVFSSISPQKVDALK